MSAYATAMSELCREGLLAEVLRQRDRAVEAERQRDEARRELMAQFANVGFDVRAVVTARGWGYLYEKEEWKP